MDKIPLSGNHLAIMLLCLGMFLASIADAGTKYLTLRLPVFEILFLIGAFSTLFAISYGAIRHGKKAFKSKHYKWHAVRGAAFVIASALNIFALTRLQLDQFYMFGFTNAFWIAIVGFLFFKDALNLRHLAAILVGFSTIIYMLNPSLDIDTLGAIAMLTSAFVQAFGFVPVRLMPPDESRTLFALSRGLITFIFAAPFALIGFLMPTPAEIVLLAFMGGVYVLVMILFSVAYIKASSSSVIAPFNYSQIIWGIVLGFVIFGDTPTLSTLIGSAILILTGIYIIRTER